MNEQDRTNPELIEENALLRQRIQELEQSESERKQVEAALWESRQRFQGLVETLYDWVWEVDPQGHYTYISPRIKDILGYEPEELLGKTPFEMMPTEAVQRVLEIFGSLTAEQKPIIDLENINLHKDGHPVVMETNGLPFYDSKGNFKGYRGTDRDITNRKWAEEALRESQRRLADIIEFFPDATLVIDSEGKVIAWNRAIEEMTGIKSADMIGRGNFEYALPFFNERRPLLVDRALESHEHIDQGHASVRRGENLLLEEGEVPQLKGEARFLSRRAAKIYSINGEVVGAIESIRDITEQKLIEKAFADEHEKLSSILDGSPVSTFVIDRDRWVTEWNLANEYFTGMSKRSVIGKPIDLQPFFKDKAPPTLAELVLEMPDEEIIKRYADKGVRKSVIHPEAFETVGSIWIKGREHIMAIQATRLRDAAGNVIGAIQCAHDITEQKRFEEVLRASEQRYRMIVENTNDAIYTHDLEGNIIDVNNNACLMIGYTRDELVGTNLAMIDIALCLPVHKEFEGLFREGYAIFERENIRKDGTTVPVEVSIRIISREGKGLAMRFVRDISERKQVEKERYHYEKLQGILEMAGAICHELNQPMQIISGYSEMILMNSSENDPIHGKLDTIIKQIHRMGTITRKLMTIKDYETQDYAGISRIVDINKSSRKDTE